eukprot:1418058-Pleurochrysis_carterae.AAC.2
MSEVMAVAVAVSASRTKVACRVRERERPQRNAAGALASKGTILLTLFMCCAGRPKRQRCIHSACVVRLHPKTMPMPEDTARIGEKTNLTASTTFEAFEHQKGEADPLCRCAAETSARRPMRSDAARQARRQMRRRNVHVVGTQRLMCDKAQHGGSNGACCTGAGCEIINKAVAF